VARSADDFEALANEHEALILDVRSETDFVNGYIPNSVFIGLDGSFAAWVGALITDLKQPILLVCPESRQEEAVTRLSRVGYDNTLGYLSGGIEAWKAAGKDVETIVSISAEDFVAQNATNSLSTLDVRKKSEYDAEHLVSAENFPLDFINKNMDKINIETPYSVHCAGGYRSVVAISILKARGFDKLTNIEGGFKAIQATNNAEITEYVCQATAL
jgi:rhodanese-related sulfurtransferase